MTESTTGDRRTAIDRRRFDRIELTEDAYAVDQNGRELGKVRQAGGGGMLIIIGSGEVADSLKKGDELKITVMEPASQTSHTIDVIVRYHDKEQIGCEFVTGPAAR